MSLLTDTYPTFVTALTLWREARSQPEQAKLGVLWVILNRSRDPRWPNTLHEVCLQPYQFSCHNPTDPNSSRLPAPKAKLDWKAWEECCDLAESPGVLDPTGGANHYHSLRDGQDFPAWALPEKVTARLGAFTFYKL